MARHARSQPRQPRTLPRKETTGPWNAALILRSSVCVKEIRVHLRRNLNFFFWAGEAGGAGPHPENRDCLWVSVRLALGIVPAGIGLRRPQIASLKAPRNTG